MTFPAKSICSFASAVGTLALTAAALADIPSAGSIVIAKPSGHAIIIWDASSEIKSALDSKTADDQISTQLEVQAVRILIDRAKNLTAASDIRVKVVYDRTGDVSPAYKASTFSGIEHLLVVSATRDAALHQRKTWSTALDRGTVPSGVSVDVTGKYPS